ncbi:MAG: LON peptidase substrate-binding domain-containing protein [Pelagimonas sp.]|jgi:Lon protease-like protein|nr:LON peptidase substrate-binding domain-containing protein [Pelagimonas sp.]
MSWTKDLPDVLPVFPLTGALLLPRARLPLQIFEPRYLAMLEDCLKTDARLIGMIQPNEVEGRGGHGLHVIGCAGRVSHFTETDDGRYLITLSGISRFRIVQEIEGFSPYRRCQVSFDGFERDRSSQRRDQSFDRAAFLALLDRFFRARDVEADWKTLEDADDELLVNSLSMLLDFGPEDKQALLEAPSLATRRETLVTLMEYALRGGEKDVLQ